MGLWRSRAAPGSHRRHYQRCSLHLTSRGLINGGIGGIYRRWLLCDRLHRYLHGRRVRRSRSEWRLSLATHKHRVHGINTELRVAQSGEGITAQDHLVVRAAQQAWAPHDCCAIVSEWPAQLRSEHYQSLELLLLVCA